MKAWFDGLILKNLIEKGFGPFGYQIGSRSYCSYYSRDAFTAFKLEMGFCHPEHYNRYVNGQGSELLETETPPKMASVASSSRFAYLALRWGAEAIGGTGHVEFEHECRIQGIRGTAPQLDAYTTDKDGNPVYVEVKCHEIFDQHSVKLQPAYWDWICGKGNAFGFPAQDPKGTADAISLPLDAFGIYEKNSMVDIKQLLCHLLGIASQKDASQTATLVYLFFKPLTQAHSDDWNRVNKCFDTLTGQLSCVFRSTPIRSFCSTHKINLKVIVEEAATMERLTADNIGYQKEYPHN